MMVSNMPMPLPLSTVYQMRGSMLNWVPLGTSEDADLSPSFRTPIIE